MRFVLSYHAVRQVPVMEVHDPKRGGFIASIVPTPEGHLKIISKHVTGYAEEDFCLPIQTATGHHIRAIVVHLSKEPQPCP